MGKKTASGYLFDAVTSPGWATGFFQTESLKDRRKEQEQQSQKKKKSGKRKSDGDMFHEGFEDCFKRGKYLSGNIRQITRNRTGLFLLWFIIIEQ